MRYKNYLISEVNEMVKRSGLYWVFPSDGEMTALRSINSPPLPENLSRSGARFAAFPL